MSLQVASPRLCALSVSLAVACVDAGRPAFRASASVIRGEQAHAEAASATATAAELGPEAPIPAAWINLPQRVSEEGGTFHILVGALRVDVRSEKVTAARDLTAGVVRAAAHVERGWVFLTEGALYASDTFTGRLRALRSFGCARGDDIVVERGSVQMTVGRDRAGITDGVNAWWTDGAAVHDAGTDTLSIAWHDATWGTRITTARLLQSTHDGGTTWRDVDLHDALPLLLSPREDRVILATPEDSFQLDARDAVRSLGATDPEAFGEFEAVCDISDRAMELARSASTQPYAVARPLLPAETCAQRAARLRPAWEAPSLAVRVTEVSGADAHDRGTLHVDRADSSRLWRNANRRSSGADGATVLIAVDYDERPPRRTVATMQWRGDDERGAFNMRAVNPLPSEIIVGAYSRLLGASRHGALFELVAEPTADPRALNADTSAVRTMYWFTARGVERVSIPGLTTLDAVGAVPTADGGLVVLGTREACTHGRCDGLFSGACARSLVLYQLDVNGAVRGHREVPFDGAARTLVGVGELEGRWGFVTAPPQAHGTLSLWPLNGATVPFGTWSSEGVPTICGDAPGAARLHLFDTLRDETHPLPVHVRTTGTTETVSEAQVKVVTFERAGSGLCVRRVWASRQGGYVMVGPEDYRTAWSPLRLQAHDGALTGVIDDGERLSLVRATVASEAAPR